MPSIDHPNFDITTAHVDMTQEISAMLQLLDNMPRSEDNDVFDEHSWPIVTQDSVGSQSYLTNSGDAQRYIQDVQDDKFLSVADISKIIYDDDVSLEYMMLQQHEVRFVTFDYRKKVRLVAEEHLTLDPGGAFHSNVCLTTEEHPALNSGGVSHMNAIFLETTHFAMFMNLMIHLQVVYPCRWINYKSHDILGEHYEAEMFCDHGVIQFHHSRRMISILSTHISESYLMREYQTHRKMDESTKSAEVWRYLFEVVSLHIQYPSRIIFAGNGP
jgi:hypothetical protein